MAFNPITASLESIAFQSGIFHKQLSEIFETYYREVLDNTNEINRLEDYKKTSNHHKDLENKLTKCIKMHTNMNIDVNINEYDPCVEVPEVDKNNPMIANYGWENYITNKTSLREVRKEADKKINAFMDKEKSRVSGFFEKMKPTKMHISYRLVDDMLSPEEAKENKKTKRLSAQELAAVMLHEVGHIWTFFEFMCRFRTTNQILVSTLRELEGTEDHSERQYIIKEASGVLELKEGQLGDLADKSNSTVYTILLTNFYRNNLSQSGAEGYDLNSFEALADQFSTRHGGGRYIVSALDKIVGSNRISKRGPAMYLFMEVIKLSTISLLAIMPQFAYFVILLFVYSVARDSYSPLYDKEGYRFQRVRNQLIELLKNYNLPKEVSDKARADIDEIEKITANYKDYVQLLGLINDYIIPSVITARKQAEFQQKLETMSSNKLFYFANQFKHS